MNFPVWMAGEGFIGFLFILTKSVFTLTTLSAFGAGVFLAIGEKRSLFDSHAGYREFMKKFTGFTLFIVTVLGTVSYAGLWIFYILTAPATLSTIVHEFIWVWILQGFAYLLEVGSLFVLYSTFNKIHKENHVDLAWSFAILSLITLIVANATLSFQQTPGHWINTLKFEDAWFNASYLASLSVRILVSVQTGGIIALLAVSTLEKGKLKSEVASFAASFVIYPFILLPFAALWFLATIDPVMVESLTAGFSGVETSNLSVLTRFTVLAIFAGVSVFLFTLLGAVINADGFKKAMGFWLVVLAFVAAGSTEYVRTLLGNPYAIAGYMYNNGIKLNDADQFSDGFLSKTKWSVIKEITEENRLAAGKELYTFQYSGSVVHSGYNSLLNLAGSAGTVQETLDLINQIKWGSESNVYTAYVPSFLGNDDEANALATYVAWKNGKYKATKEQIDFLKKLETAPSGMVQ